MVPSFKILAVATHDGHLVVTTQHFKPDGSPWFAEHYIFQGREGVKRKRAVNALGQLLQDDGSVAPTRLVRKGLSQEPEQYLELGKRWMFRSEPHIDESSILSVIRLTHARRLVSGWGRTADTIGRLRPMAKDMEGCDILLARFQRLVGFEE